MAKNKSGTHFMAQIVV